MYKYMWWRRNDNDEVNIMIMKWCEEVIWILMKSNDEY